MISPIDGRYYNEKTDSYLNEDVLLKCCIEVEWVIFYAHLKRKGISGYTSNLSPDGLHLRILEEELKTHHQIKAIVNVMKDCVNPKYKSLVHLGVTSSDICDTAYALMLRRANNGHIFPLMGELIHSLRHLHNEYGKSNTIGRTHGQHAVPMTFGHMLSEYESRLSKSMENCICQHRKIGGKISGAVGNYMGMSIVMEDPVRFEGHILKTLGLPKSDCYTQIVEPEYILRFLLEINIFFGIIANLADDIRNLQRSEIGELAETFGKTQVGSSTMPHKRNPWNSEHVKSMWKAFSPRVMTFYMDQISDHQRDLTGSASGRFITEYLAGFCNAVDRMNSVIKGLQVNSVAMNDHYNEALWIPESIYILLADRGHNEAYAICREISAISKDNRDFMHKFKHKYRRLYRDIRLDIVSNEHINRYAI